MKNIIDAAGQTGNFQLNVTLPLIAANLLDSIQLLSLIHISEPTRPY